MLKAWKVATLRIFSCSYWRHVMRRWYVAPWRGAKKPDQSKTAGPGEECCTATLPAYQPVLRHISHLHRPYTNTEISLLKLWTLFDFVSLAVDYYGWNHSSSSDMFFSVYFCTFQVGCLLLLLLTHTLLHLSLSFSLLFSNSTSLLPLYLLFALRSLPVLVQVWSSLLSSVHSTLLDWSTCRVLSVSTADMD